MTEKKFCDYCERIVSCKTVKYDNNLTICKKHLDKLGYYRDRLGGLRKC